MLELIDKSDKVNRFLWGLMILLFITGISYLLPDILKALAEYQQALN
ncbi:Uncharacterised protein [Canicola haemoglobinophilus]|uniref:Uncharacterized protein n=1 Tax=Canicola haemoglobinophilus TaxID=733 RepID=A0A377HXC4_9PAST|nr:hypothetical protein [Canicola haemoglobinophilus]STO61041.1 Uncharacterised protein [Canicola haemoglobinophilus]